MNLKNKLASLLGLTGLAATAAAATLTAIAGELPANTFHDHYYRVGTGSYVVDLRNLSDDGDLDAKVFADDGTLLGKDTMDDNNPVVWFHSDHAQTVKVRAINASPTERAIYTGSIEVDD